MTRDANRTYIDVDQYLMDLNRAWSHYTSAQTAAVMAGYRGVDDLLAAAQTLRQDPQHASDVQRLSEAARAWTGDPSEFLDEHAARL